ncbi:cyclin-D3-1-like protein [Tanacetum coccineum]
MAILSPYSSSFLDTLFCNEDHEDTLVDSSHVHSTPLDQQDLCWDHEELVSLLTKEHQPCTFVLDKTNPCVRKLAVEWILKVKHHYGFTPLTAILAINYFDRFVSSVDEFKKDEPWMVQLVAVTCLSLAAKVEETHVPLLLDLQVEDSDFFFEAKNIQKMELLVMSALKWRMNPVTPISFLDHIVRRLGLTNHNGYWDFFNKCEALVLCLVKDSRFVCYKPSILATATMLRVIDEIDPTNSIDYKSQLLDLLKTTKENVNECYELVMELSYDTSNKRKPNGNDSRVYPDSPSGVIDFTCDESSNDSWEFSSPHFREPLSKKTRIDQQFGFGSLISFAPY